MNAQFIQVKEGSELAVVDANEYRRLYEFERQTKQDAADIAKADMAWQEYQDNPEQQVPTALFYKVLDGENPIKVYREWRGLTQGQLAKQVHITTGYLCNIEKGTRQGKVGVYVKIAKCLNVALEYIVPMQTNEN